jgi:signal transduction histidine kinase
VGASRSHSRQFDSSTPAPKARPGLARENEHRVQFYDGEEFLASAVADYLGTGLTTGDSLVVIASEPHRWAFLRRLEAQGHDVEAATRNGRVTLIDARETLRTFMSGGAPNARRFRHTIGGVLDGARSRSTSGSGLRLYGEMVDLLWKDGNADGAIRLEELWNDLAQRSPFTLLCAYSMSNFSSADDAERFADVCGHHTHVVPTERYVGGSDKSRLMEISVLQQRAQALEAELEHRKVLEHRLRETLLERERVEEELRARDAEMQALLGERERLLEAERTARGEAELARVEAENATRAKSQFLAVMSHELRTPLNAIAGHVQLVAMGIHGAVTDAQVTALDRVARSQRHLLRLINEVLNLARIETGRVEYTVADVAVQDVITELLPMVEPQLAANGIELAIRLPAERLVVSADREKLAQVMLNLLSNSAKFTPAGGLVTIDVATRAEVEGLVFVRVTDTGIGIPRDKHEAIFEPFVQVHSGPTRTTEGAGLGLAISRELARGMSGDLRVRSAEGCGSTFTLALRRGATGS